MRLGSTLALAAGLFFVTPRLWGQMPVRVIDTDKEDTRLTKLMLRAVPETVGSNRPATLPKLQDRDAQYLRNELLPQWAEDNGGIVNVSDSLVLTSTGMTLSTLYTFANGRGALLSENRFRDTANNQATDNLMLVEFLPNNNLRILKGAHTQDKHGSDCVIVNYTGITQRSSQEQAVCRVVKKI